MATIDDVIRAYYLHKSQRMMNFLNNLFRDYSNRVKFSPKMVVRIIEGEHQRRLIYDRRWSYSVLVSKVKKNLMKTDILINSYKSFEELYDEVKNNIAKIEGIGNLTIYDIALRIGYIRKDQILPKAKIYLCAGARIGAKNLYARTPSLFDSSGILDKELSFNKDLIIDKNIFKEPLCNVPSMFLEDLLCVYHNDLANLSDLKYSDLQKVKNYCDSK